MSEQNVTIVRAVYDSFAAGDVDAVFAAMTPDIEWDESEGMPYGGVYQGREPIVSNVFRPILADVEGFTAAPDEILPLDESRVVALGRHGGRGANGPVRARFVHIWTASNGLVARYSNSPTSTPSEPLSASSYRRSRTGADHSRCCVATRRRLRRWISRIRGAYCARFGGRPVGEIQEEGPGTRLRSSS
jgi:uncharacterized protein